MSVVAASGAANGLSATTNLASFNNCTKMLWVQHASAPAALMSLIGMYSSGATDYTEIVSGWNSISGALALQLQSGAVEFGSLPTTTDWVCYAFTSATAGAGSVIGYWQDNAGGGWNTATRTGVTASNNTDCIAGGGGLGNPTVNISMAYFKEWNTVLTPTQLTQEFNSATVVNTANLNRYLAMSAAGSAGTDTSGNGFNMTVSGTLTTGSSNPTFPTIVQAVAPFYSRRNQLYFI
jgi:hypothetical protein